MDLKLDRRNTKLSMPPYVPAKEPRVIACLNCSVHASVDLNDVKKGTAEVACRHLAMEFARHSGPKRELLERFDDEVGIRSLFDGRCAKLDDDFDTLSSQDLDVFPRRIIEETRLGECMAALVEGLPEPGMEEGTELNLAIVTENHAMACHLQRKRKEGAPPYCSATFYDPNDTNVVRRYEVQDPKGFERVTMREMLVNPESIESYGSAGPLDALPIAVIVADAPSIGSEGFQAADLKRVKEPRISSATIALILEHGDAEQTGSMSRHVAAMSAQQSLSLMTERSLAGGTISASGYLRCMANDRDSSKVEAAIRMVTDSSMRFEDKKDILQNEAWCEFGIEPGSFLLDAMSFGDSHPVKGFSRGVLGSSKLASEQMVDLLMEKDGTGVPALNKAMDVGNADAVREFAQQVLYSSKLSVVQKFELLESEDDSGLTAVARGLALGNVERVGTLVQAIGRFPSPPGARMKLMFGKEPCTESSNFKILKALDHLAGWLPPDMQDYLVRHDIALSPAGSKASRSP